MTYTFPESHRDTSPPQPRARLYVLSRYPQLSETFVSNEVGALRDMGLEVDVLSIERGEPLDGDGPAAGTFRVLRHPSLARAAVDHLWAARTRPRRYWRFCQAVLRLRDMWRVALRCVPTEVRQIDAATNVGGLHTHFAWSTASLAAYMGLLLELPATITVHANDIYVGDRSRLRARLSRFRRVVTVCHFNVGLLCGMGVEEVGGDGICVVPCGVAVPAQDASAAVAPAPTILSVGRLVEKKGFDTLIRAMAVVREASPQARAVIIGDGPHRAALSRLIEELDLGETVRLAGAMSHGKVLHAIAAADVFCLACRRAADGDCDALPVVLREAMVRGVPVVSTRLTGIPETVDDEVGWLVSPDSHDELAAALIEALNEPAERIKRGRAGRDRVRGRWTLRHQADGMLRVFAACDLA